MLEYSFVSHFCKQEIKTIGKWLPESHQMCLLGGFTLASFTDTSRIVTSGVVTQSLVSLRKGSNYGKMFFTHPSVSRWSHLLQSSLRLVERKCPNYTLPTVLNVRNFTIYIFNGCFLEIFFFHTRSQKSSLQ